MDCNDLWQNFATKKFGKHIWGIVSITNKSSNFLRTWHSACSRTRCKFLNSFHSALPLENEIYNVAPKFSSSHTDYFYEDLLLRVRILSDYTLVYTWFFPKILKFFLHSMIQLHVQKLYNGISIHLIIWNFLESKNVYLTKKVTKYDKTWVTSANRAKLGFEQRNSRIMEPHARLRIFIQEHKY